jgi:hypothetical protein
VAAIGLALAASAAVIWWPADTTEVQTFTVREEDGSAGATVLNATGYVTARLRATIASEITGRLVELRIEEGMPIAKGDVVARLDDKLFRAALMGIGAVFGAVNTMYSAVSARTREIATLRALGFRGAPVVISVMVESMILALAGGLVGGLTAYLAFNGYQASTLNFQSFSQVAFSFRVTPGLMMAGIAVSLLLGLLGGIFPAVRAARIPVATALREL